MQEKLFDVLFDKEDITWQTMIYSLVREEQMDPWDIDIAVLSKRFITMLKQLKEMDFRVSGKILLAAAILLRLKSNRLVGQDLQALDSLIASNEDMAEEFYEELEGELARQNAREDIYSIIPRTPQPRKRKVSVYDLVDALNKALEVENRRVGKAPREAPAVEIPTDHKEISLIIRDVYLQIQGHYDNQTNGTLKFSQLLPANASKVDRVFTFIPLLHLDHQRKIELLQQQHFGEIEIEMLAR